MDIIKKIFEKKEECVNFFLDNFCGTNVELNKQRQLKYINAVIEGLYPDVIVKERKLVQLIIDWTKKEDPICTLIKLFKQINVQFPVKLRELTGDNDQTFMCETATGKNLYISMEFGDGFESCDEMSIEYDNRISLYNYYSSIDTFTLQSTNIVREGRELYSRYSEYSSCMQLNIDNCYSLVLEVNELNSLDKSKVHVIMYSEEIEEYLLGFDGMTKKSFDDSCEKIQELYDFSDQDMRELPKFKMVLTQKIDNKNYRIIQSIIRHKGKVQQYATTIGCITALWNRDGSWSYNRDPDYEVSGNKKSAKITFNVDNEEHKQPIVIDVNDYVKNAREYVSKEVSEVIILPQGI